MHRLEAGICMEMTTISSTPYSPCLDIFQLQQQKKNFELLPTMAFNQGNQGNAYLTGGDSKEDSTYGFVRPTVEALFT